MKWTGKVIGFLVGYIAGGPFTAVLGLLIGHFFDKGLSFESFSQTFQNQSQTQQVFFRATFCVMGYIAKSDGRVSEEEIRQARVMMANMELSESQKLQAIQFFTLGKQPGFNLDHILAELKNACHAYPDLLRLFIEIQFQTASIVGQISPEKRRILKYICQYLGFTTFDFSAFDQSSRAHQRQYQHRTYNNYQTEEPIKDSYQILGISKHANDEEVKKAYRKLMSQHHPDKLIAKGLPQSMIKIATEKTQEIKLAYEKICKARGMK